MIRSTTQNTRVSAFTSLVTPGELKSALPLGPTREALVRKTRADVENVLGGTDDRLLVVVGPCSVHDPEAALDYARRLATVAAEHADDLCVVMRVYFEKPRSTGGWKGLINDPHLDGTHRVGEGLEVARRLLLDVLDLGLAVGGEFLEPTSPHYIADAITWGAIGARTTQSQIHRQLASGLSMPIGFKNATDGDVGVAVEGVRVAAQPHVFFGVDDAGRSCLVSTTGNEHGHVILRGGKSGPNFATDDLAAAAAVLAVAHRDPRLVVDASHANSGKDHVRQGGVVRELAVQIAQDEPVAGVMMESFLVPGRQDLTDAGLLGLRFGQSVTDACLGWDETASLLGTLAEATRARRRVRTAQALVSR